MKSRALISFSVILLVGMGLGMILGLFLSRSTPPEQAPAKSDQWAVGSEASTATYGRLRSDSPQGNRRLLPEEGRDVALADYRDKFFAAKRSLGGDLQREAYGALVRAAALELGYSNHLATLRDVLAAEGIAGWALDELMRQGVMAVLQTGSPEEHLANWMALENDKMKLHSAASLGAVLSTSQIEELIATGVDGKLREHLVSGYAKSFASSDSAGALKAFLEHCSPRAEAALSEIIRQIQPTADFPHLLTILPRDEPGRPLAAREFMLRVWAWSDPQVAANHIRDTGGTMSAKHLGRVLETWAHHPARYREVADWAASLPRGALRDQAAASLASRLGSADPTQAWNLALSMTSQEEGWRTRTLQGIYERWHRDDSSAADAALDALEVVAE